MLKMSLERENESVVWIRGAVRRVIWPAFALLLSSCTFFSYSDFIPLAGLADPGGAVRFLDPLVGGVAYFSAAWLFSRLIDIAWVRGDAELRTPRLLGELLSGLAFGLASLSTISLIYDPTTLGAAATSGVLIAVLGISLRDVMADVFSGIALGLERSYRKGDWVEIEPDLTARVVEINWRVTRFQTRDGVTLIVPNGQLAKQRLKNYSSPSMFYRYSLELTLDHSLGVDDARKVLLDAVISTEAVSKYPAPDVRVSGYSQSGLSYLVRFWVSDYAQEIDCRDAVLAKVDRHLRGLKVPPPRRHHYLSVGEAKELRPAS
jgi:small-conductance mechanosensitive channel